MTTHGARGAGIENVSELHNELRHQHEHDHDESARLRESYEGNAEAVSVLETPKSRSPDIAIKRKPVPGSAGSEDEANAKCSQVAKEKESLLRTWWLEMISCIMALSALAGMTIVLYIYRGRPLPQLPFGISVNALVSIFVVVIKGSLVIVLAAGIGQLKWTWLESDRPLYDLELFDQASRGSWGCLCLLWHVHIRQAAASLGAILTVAILASDPLTQQMIHYVGCSDSMSGEVATLPRAILYEDTGYHIGAEQSSVSTGVQASINSGIFAPAGQVSFACPTGNCTFAQEYGSLAYCSSCTDISDSIEVKSVCYKQGTDDELPCTDVSPEDFDDYSIFYNTTSALPGSLSMLIHPRSGILDVASMTVVPSSTSGINAVQIMVPSLNVTDSERQCNGLTTAETWRCKQYGAAECTLFPCIRRYSANITAGILSEQELSRTPKDIVWVTQAPVGNWGIADLTCANNEELQGLREAGYAFSNGQKWLPFNVTYFTDVKFPPDPDANDIANATLRSLFTHHCLFVMDALDASDLWSSYLDQYFSGTIQGTWTTWPTGAIAPVGSTTQPILVEGSQALQTMYNFGDTDFTRFEEIFANISDSLTNYIREHGNVNYSANVVGEVIHYAVCLDVRWAWITFLASMVAFSIIFCSLVYITVTTKRSKIWKSSQLTMIYNGPFVGPLANSAIGLRPAHDDGGSKLEPFFSGLQRVAEMELLAQSIIVRMDKYNGKLVVSELQVKGQ